MGSRKKANGGSWKYGESGGSPSRNPFFNYLNLYRNTHQDMPDVQTALEASKRWQALSHEEKRRYMSRQEGAPLRRTKKKRETTGRARYKEEMPSNGSLTSRYKSASPWPRKNSKSGNRKNMMLNKSRSGSNSSKSNSSGSKTEKNRTSVSRSKSKSRASTKTPSKSSVASSKPSKANSDIDSRKRRRSNSNKGRRSMSTRRKRIPAKKRRLRKNGPASAPSTVHVFPASSNHEAEKTCSRQSVASNKQVKQGRPSQPQVRKRAAGRRKAPAGRRKSGTRNVKRKTSGKGPRSDRLTQLLRKLKKLRKR